MERKQIRIPEKPEKTRCEILEMERTFGWKEESNEKLKGISYQFAPGRLYTLSRDVDGGLLTQAHRDTEKRWDEQYRFIYDTLLWKVCPICFAAAFLWLGGFVIAMAVILVGRVNGLYMDLVSLDFGLLVVLLIFCFVLPVLALCIVPYAMFVRKRNALMASAEETRNVFRLRKERNLDAENAISANAAGLRVLEGEIDSENLKDLKRKVHGVLREKGNLAFIGPNGEEKGYGASLSKDDFSITIHAPFGSVLEKWQLRLSNNIGDAFFVDGKEANVAFEGEDRLIPLEGKPQVLKIEWQISYSFEGKPHRLRLAIHLPLRYLAEL